MSLRLEQKPVAFMKEFVLRYTDPGDVVLDCFAGSGSTAVACLETGRITFNLEMDIPCWEVTFYRRILPAMGIKNPTQEQFDELEKKTSTIWENGGYNLTCADDNLTKSFNELDPQETCSLPPIRLDQMPYRLDSEFVPSRNIQRQILAQKQNKGVQDWKSFAETFQHAKYEADCSKLELQLAKSSIPKAGHGVFFVPRDSTNSIIAAGTVIGRYWGELEPSEVLEHNLELQNNTRLVRVCYVFGYRHLIGENASESHSARRFWG